jgi:hypothetical protein
MNSNRKYIIIIIITNLLFYLPVIFSSITFFDDDYIIFAYIQNNISQPFISDTNAQYFLFLRPLSYFSFWIDYSFFSDNYIAMKVVSLFFHICFIISFYYLLKRVITLFNIDVNDIAAIFVSLILSIHLDCLLWISLICNRTEQLMILFYVLSSISFLKYFDHEKRLYLLLSALFFLMSALAKQSGLHLPLIFLYFVIYTKKMKPPIIRELKLFFIFTLIMLISFSILNFIIYHDQVGITENIWKKPFTIIGILLHSVVPIFSNYIYNFFIINKELAAIVGFSILIILLILLRKLKISRKKIIYLSILVALILYPRIFAVGSQRLNGVLLIWLCILMLFIVGYIRNKSLAYIFLGFIVIFQAISFIIRSSAIIEGNNFKEEKFQKFFSNVDINSGNTLVLCSDTFDILPYKYHYYSKKTFGKSDNILTTPIFYELVLVNHDLSLYKKDFINCRKDGAQYIITASDPLIYLLIYQHKIDSDFIIVKDKKESDSGRGYKEITFELTNKMTKNVSNIIYFTGTKWIEIK